MYVSAFHITGKAKKSVFVSVFVFVFLFVFVFVFVYIVSREEGFRQRSTVILCHDAVTPTVTSDQVFFCS